VGLNWFFLEILILFWGLVVITFIDFDHQIIPDEFSLSGIVIGLVGSLVFGLMRQIDQLPILWILQKLFLQSMQF
jgi:leader peptidase (prepilin peptidase)/N-methyltransferase